VSGRRQRRRALGRGDLSVRLRALGWSLVFLAGGLGLSLALLRLIPATLRLAHGEALSLAALQAVVLLVAFGFLSWLVGGRVLRFRLADFGVVPAGPGVRRFGAGLLVGLGLAALAMIIAVPVGGAAWRDDGGAPGAWLTTVLATAALLLPAALAEELIFRGVPLVALSRAFGRWPALLGLAVLFGLAHLFNPGVTPLAVFNIALAGVFLGLAFFTPGGLWTSSGAHLGWNLGLAGLAAPVSGLPLPLPWLDYLPGGPRWLTGGPFGPEGGLLGSLCLAGGALLAARHMTRETLA